MRRPCLIHAVPVGLLSLALLAGGCVGAKTPAQAVRDSPEPAKAVGVVHLASLTIVELNTDYGVAVAIEPQAATFPAGETQFEVLNKWHGLSPGSHVERIRVLSSDGSDLLFQDQTTFEVTPDHLTLTVVEVVRLSGAPPGTYWVAIDLDGTEITRYTFRLVAADAADP